ncbi:hypothetical protein V6N11_071357 [Hibiscus sabdariffa]|uniref:Uncharacterized protein n=2 Tax=Hibiscus sabdariffa TaxID=183260 RepID=A0ABR2TZX5_9ROSI
MSLEGYTRLHYKRIEELGAQNSSASASAGSNASQGVGVPQQPERFAKIRSQFKTFLSEATGFYHDLILKIGAKYGLQFGCFSDDSDSRGRVVMDKDGKKSADIKKGLVSCHRCLIYLGDLARDKGLYGDGDSKSQSSYFLQFPRDVKSPIVKPLGLLLSGKSRMKDEAKLEYKDARVESCNGKEKVSGDMDTYKLFCIRFVRLNDIIFTRTSPETFGDVLALVSHDLRELLSSGPEEELNFGRDAAENSLLCIRLVSILIFTVNNLKRESEGQTYAEIVQRAALLQNAFTAVFELVGHVIERCFQLQDVSSSYSLPGIMVFVEWMACYPDVAATGCDVDEKQSIARSYFWKHFI